MASIVKRKKKYSVVYTYTDENGNKRQKWETFETNSEAKKRKLQVEYEQESGTFIPPSAKTVNDLLDEYMSIYGVNTWAMSIIMDKMLPIPDNSLSQPSQYPKVTVGLFGYAVSSDLKLPSEFVKYSRIAAWSR